MEQKLLDYMALYQNDCEFMPTEQEHCEVCGADVTVAVCEYDHAHEYRVSAHILLEKNGSVELLNLNFVVRIKENKSKK